MFDPNKHLMNLKGKDYLQVMWRLVWFREDKPLWCIDTKLEQLTDNHAVFSAKIYDENGSQKSTGYGSESVKDFRDFIEKAETKAVGRALAMLGYGTQFAPELDEENRIVDSPVERNFKRANTSSVCSCCGNPITDIVQGGKVKKTAGEVAAWSKETFGNIMCWACAKAAMSKQEDQA